MSHYTITEIGTMAELQEMFPTGEADGLNWCFLSTSGVHGSYATLDTIEGPPEDDGYEWPYEITVLAVAPRMVRCRYGHIAITPEDVPWLRRLVSSTLEAVAKSQEGNTDA
jgi:hypothetical protein